MKFALMKSKAYTWYTIYRDVPVIHSVPGKCRISHYSVLPGTGKIMGPSNKQKFFFTFYFFLPKGVLMIPQEDKNYVRSKNVL